MILSNFIEQGTRCEMYCTFYNVMPTKTIGMVIIELAMHNYIARANALRKTPKKARVNTVGQGVQTV